MGAEGILFQLSVDVLAAGHIALRGWAAISDGGGQVLCLFEPNAIGMDMI